VENKAEEGGREGGRDGGHSMAHFHFHGAASCSGFHLFPDATFLSLCGKGDVFILFHPCDLKP
jgi:hypothetical protein